MSSESVDAHEWRCIVNRVVASWGAYQLGVDFESGGSDTLAKDEWFKDVLAEHIMTAKGLKANDLEDWLTNILYTEFNLILEDDSVYPTSLLLVEAFQHLKQSNRMGLDNLIATLPSIDAVREANKMSRAECIGEEEEMNVDDIDESDESDHEMEDVQSRKERFPRMITDEEGWTTILRK